MFTDELDLRPLVSLAKRIGMRESWLQKNKSAPHFDLTSGRRAAAVKLGAVEVDRAEAVRIWRARRELVHQTEVAANG